MRSEYACGRAVARTLHRDLVVRLVVPLHRFSRAITPHYPPPLRADEGDLFKQPRPRWSLPHLHTAQSDPVGCAFVRTTLVEGRDEKGNARSRASFRVDAPGPRLGLTSKPALTRVDATQQRGQLAGRSWLPRLPGSVPGYSGASFGSSREA